MGQAAKAALHTDNLDAVADRGYFKGEEILVPRVIRTEGIVF
jgi:transposase